MASMSCLFCPSSVMPLVAGAAGAPGARAGAPATTGFFSAAGSPAPGTNVLVRFTMSRRNAWPFLPLNNFNAASRSCEKTGAYQRRGRATLVYFEAGEWVHDDGGRVTQKHSSQLSDVRRNKKWPNSHVRKYFSCETIIATRFHLWNRWCFGDTTSGEITVES